MNEKLAELFERFKHFRVVSTIVEEILTLDYYVNEFDEQKSIALIDFCVGKYGKEISKIGALYTGREVVEDDPHLYERKDEKEVNSDIEFIRDCLIIIGAVQSGIRPDYKTVVMEINE